MKKILFLLLLLSTCFAYAQEKIVKKPEYVVIINDSIITKADVDEYGKQGYVKAMAKGVSDEERARLAKKLGDKIGDKQFIVIVSLFTEKEREENLEKIKNSISKKASAQSNNEYILNAGDSAKNFTVKMITGENIKLPDLKGKVVLLNFWATWCAPCIMEFYDFPSKLIAPYKNDQFILLPVSIGETMAQVKGKMAKLKKDGIDFNVGIDPNKSIFNLYATGSIPKSFLIDKNGIIRYVSTGNDEDSLNKISLIIRELLNE